MRGSKGGVKAVLLSRECCHFMIEVLDPLQESGVVWVWLNAG
jgi:hypothetical protein